MDDLDLDDALFLEGEIDLDLGDIFESDNTTTNNNNTNNNGAGGGGLMDAFDFGDGQSGYNQHNNNNNNTISPTIKKRRASRTARSNPHQTSNTTTTTNKSSSPTANVSKSELNSLLSDAILPTNVKRTRRKSKKYIDSSATNSSDDNDDNTTNSEIQQQYYYGNNTRYDGSQKQSRRKSSVSSNKQASSGNNKGVVGDKQNRRVSIQEMPRVIHSGQPSSQDYNPTGGSGGGGPTPQQIQQLQLLRQQQLRQQQQQQIAYQNQLQQQQKQHKQAAINQLQTIQQSLTDYGLNYSPSQFYPYLNTNSNNNNGLPQQVEKEKSVNKVYPMLHKLAVNSTQSYEGGVVDQEEGKDGLDEMKSPLYTLFDKHIGALPNANTNSTNYGGPCNKLLMSLSNVTQSVSNQLLSNEGSSKKNNKDQGRSKRYERQGSKQQQQVNDEDSNKSTLITELSKLYTQNIKQSSFLRQNLINMESYIFNHTILNKHTTDIFGTTTKKGKGAKGKETTTTTSRKEIEEVIKLVNMNDRYTLLNERNVMIQKLHYQQSLKHHHQQQQQAQQQQQQAQQQQMKEWKKICNNRYALPPPIISNESNASSKQPQVVTGNDGTTYVLQSNDVEYTHGGPNLTPVTSVKVKVRVNGSIVKGSSSSGGSGSGSGGGSKLVARLWCPQNWKIARKNAELVLKSKALGTTSTSSTSGKQNTVHGGIPSSNALSMMPSYPVVPNIPKPDLSLVDVDTMRIVANELCRFDLLSTTATSGSSGGGGDSSKRKRRKSNKDESGGKKSTTDKAVSFASSLAEIEKIVKEQRMGGSEISSSTNNTNTKDGKKKEAKKRKRKTKDKSSTAATAAASPSKKATPSPKKTKRMKTTTIPPRKPPIYNESDVHSQEQQRLQHTLYEHILNPKTLPSDKRTILANEIASSLQRLEKARTTTTSGNSSSKSYYSSTKMKEIDDQIKELQSIVEEDVDIVPDSCNTIGLWNYMNKTNYFDTIRNVTDVQYGMEGIVEQSEEDVIDVGRNDELFDRDSWGAMDKVSSSTTTKKNKEEEEAPLFDRLQSLLVEVDDGSGSEDDDDDDIANLQSNSESELSSPNKKSSPPTTSQDDDGSRVDVSALTLDQRTFIQLRAAGFHNVRIPSSTTTPQSSSTSQGEKGPLISDVLEKMKSRLSSLHSETNAQVSSIKDKVALATLISPPQHQNEKRDVDVDAATLIKYKQLERAQKKG